MLEKPYLTVPELANLCNMEEQSVRNSISRERFEIPTFKFNGQRLAHKEVVEAYFNMQRDCGMQKILTI